MIRVVAACKAIDQAFNPPPLCFMKLVNARRIPIATFLMRMMQTMVSHVRLPAVLGRRDRRLLGLL